MPDSNDSVKQISEKQMNVNAFLDKVKAFSQNNAGYQASLRRSAGKLLRSSDGNAIVNFYKSYSSNKFYEDKYFFVACIQCLWDVNDLARGVPLASCARYLDESGKSSFEKKITGLLDISWEEDGYLATKLFRVIKFCKSKNLVVDTKSLLYDLLFWDSDKHFVQKKWIREFYSVSDNFNVKEEN